MTLSENIQVFFDYVRMNPEGDYKAQVKKSVETEVMKNASQYANPKEMTAAITAIHKERVKELKKELHALGASL